MESPGIRKPENYHFSDDSSANHIPMNFSPSTWPVVLDPKLVAQSVKASLDQFLAIQFRC